jgi:2C-methyl-D-erythritol 2,4-cyclodiphosphate synthase
MGARFSATKRVSSNNTLGDISTASEDEDRPIRRIPSLRYLKKRRSSVKKKSFYIFLQFY